MPSAVVSQVAKPSGQPTPSAAAPEYPAESGYPVESAAPAPVASATPAPSAGEGELPKTFTIESFIKWLESKAGSGKARRHARAF